MFNRPTTGMLRACECDLPAHGTPMAFQHAYIALTRLPPVCYQRAEAQQVFFELSHILILPSCSPG